MYQFGLTIRSSSSSFGSSEGGSSTLGTLDPLHLPLLDILSAVSSKVTWQRLAEGSEEAPAQKKERDKRPEARQQHSHPSRPRVSWQFYFVQRLCDQAFASVTVAGDLQRWLGTCRAPLRKDKGRRGCRDSRDHESRAEGAPLAGLDDTSFSSRCSSPQG